MLRFKNFEFKHAIRIGNSGVEKIPNKYVIEHIGDKSNIVIAYLTYSSKEQEWDFKSVGLRYLNYRTEGLEEYILAVIDLINIIKHYEEENNEL